MSSHNLIDDIAHKLNLSYISDIKCEKYYTFIYHFIFNTPATDYKIEHWRDLASYFEIETKALSSSEQIKRSIEIFFRKP